MHPQPLMVQAAQHRPLPTACAPLVAAPRRESPSSNRRAAAGAAASASSSSLPAAASCMPGQALDLVVLSTAEPRQPACRHPVKDGRQEDAQRDLT
eukprot:1135262-Pleurochrysis_carterae.AAC.4